MKRVIAVSGMRAMAHRAASLASRLGLDANPLRRGMDRAEAWLRIGLVLLFLIGAPLAAAGVGHWTHAAMDRTARSQAASEYRVPATLLADVPTSTSYTARGMTEAKARWTSPAGKQVTGEIQAPVGARKGSTVEIWTDHAGHVTGAPLTSGEVAGQVVTAAVLTLISFAVVVLAALGLVHHLLERRRMAAWEAAWSAVEPHWTKRLH